MGDREGRSPSLAQHPEPREGHAPCNLLEGPFTLASCSFSEQFSNQESSRSGCVDGDIGGGDGIVAGYVQSGTGLP